MNPDDLMVLGWWSNADPGDRPPPWMLASEAQHDQFALIAERNLSRAGFPHLLPHEEALERAARGWTLPRHPRGLDLPDGELPAPVVGKLLLIIGAMDMMGPRLAGGVDPSDPWSAGPGWDHP